MSGAQTQPWDNTAFNSDGSLKPAYLARMDQAIRSLDAQGMVAIVSYFYFGQIRVFNGNETAIKDACTNATAWILSQGYTNVLVEIANECDAPDGTGSAYPAIIRPARIGELVSAIQTQSTTLGRRLNVGVSLVGGRVPSQSLAQACDFILLHANGQTAATITSMTNTVRGYGLNKPIVFNEDSTITTNFQAATDAHASWGYFDAGANNYVDGFQSPPTNWSINTVAKQNFFNLLVSLVGPTPTPTPNPTSTPRPTPGRIPMMTVGVSTSNISGGADAVFTISTSAVNPSQKTTVYYSMSGSAQVGADYTLSGVLGQTDIPAGASSTAVVLHALNGMGDKSDKATMTLTATGNYKVSKPRKATVTIANLP
jgi:hypothetical protein